jgi:hypothetical protein
MTAPKTIIMFEKEILRGLLVSDSSSNNSIKYRVYEDKLHN